MSQFKFIFLIGIFLFGLWVFFFTEKNTPEVTAKLRVMTYPSFFGVSGPGPLLAAKFSEICNCQVEFINGGEAGLLLKNLEIRNEPVDIVFGLDQLSLPTSGQWQKLSIDRRHLRRSLQEFATPYFLPLDWAPLTVLYRGNENWSSLESMLQSPDKNFLSLQDPRTSTPGLQFLWWLYAFFSDDFSVATSQVRLRAHSFSPDWSTSYGLFRAGQARATFTYVTSLIYHWDTEKDRSIQYINDPKGHPFQLEFIGIPKTSLNLDLAQSFVKFMISDEAQVLLAQRNYMLPVIEVANLGESFSQLPSLKLLSRSQLEAFEKNRQKSLDLWREQFLK